MLLFQGAPRRGLHRSPALPALAAACLALLVSATGAAADDFEYAAGIDYEKVERPGLRVTDARAEVVEFFSYQCPACWRFEPSLLRWKPTRPEDVAFVQVPVAFGARWVPTAKFFYAAQLLGVQDTLHLPLFEALHVERRNLSSTGALADFAAENSDVSAAEFATAMESFPVDMQLRRARQLADRYGVQAVPTLIVNGSYRIDPNLAGSFDRMLDMADYLSRR